VDFGVAREIESGEIMKTITGTPYFIAPEILRSKGYTEAVDLWSLGVICYTLLAGYNPFQDAADQQDLCMFLRVC
jgi:serine/threonine protein kinase